MLAAKTEDVVRHYQQRHEQRPAYLKDQPFANYGYWTRAGLRYEQAAAALTDLVAATAGIGPGDQVLDVGCGYGAGAVSYGKRCQPAAITGIDVTDVRIQTGREYVASQGLSELIDLQIGDATRTKFADASYDKLLAVECAFHFNTRRDFMREAARLLRPGGTLALTDMIPRRGINPSGYMRESGTVNTGICLENTANAYDADVYAAYLAEAGFEQIRIESLMDWTLPGFIDWMRREAKSLDEKSADLYQRSADRLAARVAAGEDYVMVVARRKS